MFDLTGQNALVTGSSRGLGFAIAKALAARGAQVFVNGRSEDRVRDAAERIGTGAVPLPFDAADPEAVEERVADLERDAPLSILVSNAAMRNRKAYFDYELSEVRAMMDANAVAPFHVGRTVARGMAERGYGRIVNMTSLTGPLARPVDQPYGMAKSALEALTRSMAAKLGGDGVTVNAIAPGFFRTESNEALAGDPAIDAWVEQRSALGRWGEPEEVAGAAVFLCSPEASFVTGQTLFVDGGMYGQY